MQLHSAHDVMLRMTRIDSIEIYPTMLQHIYRCVDPDKVSLEPAIRVLLKRDMAGRICLFEVSEVGLDPSPKLIVVDGAI